MAQILISLNGILSIKSNYSNLFVSPSQANVVQSNTQYEWNFVQCSDEYFYILTPDNAKAVSISGTGDGSNLILKTFNAADDTQKWKKSSAGSNLYYIRPKAASTMTMDIEGPSTGSGAPIQIWTHNTSAAQFKWYVL